MDNIEDITDEQLKELMTKYKEKQTRYEQIYNEAAERNEKIINHIYNEQVKRLIKNNLDEFKKYNK
jgi:hypothetical protein